MGVHPPTARIAAPAAAATPAVTVAPGAPKREANLGLQAHNLDKQASILEKQGKTGEAARLRSAAEQLRRDAEAARQAKKQQKKQQKGGPNVQQQQQQQGEVLEELALQAASVVMAEIAPKLSNLMGRVELLTAATVSASQNHGATAGGSGVVTRSQSATSTDRADQKIQTKNGKG
jgi:hypothetical protein